MEASEPKLVNSILNIIVVNSLKLGDLHITLSFIISIDKICMLHFTRIYLYQNSMGFAILKNLIFLSFIDV